MSTGMVIDGVFGSSAIDSSGEVLSIEGADISDAAAGTMVINWEHTPGEKGPGNIVGQTIYAKKIFSEDDCETERQRMYWKKVKVPYIYGVCRLYDTAGHDNAKRIAAMIRSNTSNGELVICRFSVEGNTLDSDGPHLKESVIRRVAITIKPCNRTANSGLLADPGAPEGFDKEFVKEKDILDFDDAKKSEPFNPMYMRLGGSTEIECDPILKGEDLVKTMTGGSGVGASSSMVNGDALACAEPSKKDWVGRAVKALQEYNKPFQKDEFRSYLKQELPEASDQFLDHFLEAAHDFHVKKKVLKTEEEPDGWGLLHGPTGPASGKLIKATPIKKASPQSDTIREQIGQSAFKYKLQSLSVDLNHALNQIRQPAPSNDPAAYLPQVHAIQVRVGDSLHPAGRVLIHDGKIQHLEDYHQLLQSILPPGPMDAHAAARLFAMSSNPDLEVTKDNPYEQEQVQPGSPETEPPEQVVNPAPPTRPASIFEYHRAGMDQPHTLEVVNGTYLLDGNPLEPTEIATILGNTRNGTAKIRYKVSRTQEAITKMEAQITELMKAVDVPSEERSQLHEALSAMRKAVAAGHVDPKHERTLTKHLYEDRMTPGIGNKAAADEFAGKNKPGVWVQMDGNDFSSINNAHGHEVGHSAIKAFGAAAREAMDEAVGRGPGKGKLFRNPEEQDMFRNGGDEFLAHVPSHEHAAKFARLLSQKLEAIPPIGGTHKLSMSFGFGLDPHTADKALYQAKAQKYQPGQEGVEPRMRVRTHALGQVPNLAHSLVPGAEGPVPVHSPGEAAVHDVMSDPEVNKPKPADTVAKSEEPLEKADAAEIAKRKRARDVAAFNAKSNMGAPPAPVPVAAAPAVKSPTPVATSFDFGKFGEAVRNTADKLGNARQGTFGDTGNKVFIAPVHRAMQNSGQYPGSLDQFKQHLLGAHKAGHLSLARADLQGAMNPASISESKTVHPMTGKEFHFIDRAASTPKVV